MKGIKWQAPTLPYFLSAWAIFPAKVANKAATLISLGCGVGRRRDKTCVLELSSHQQSAATKEFLLREERMVQKRSKEA